MRSRVSALVLMLYPAFVLLPALALAAVTVLTSSVWLGVLLGLDVIAELTLAFSALVPRLRARAPLPAPRVALARADGHGRLWDEVDRLAAAAGVAPPARIVLSLTDSAAARPLSAGGSATPGAAAVGTQGAYELLLSPVLLAESQVPALNAVVAHELGYVAAGSFPDQDLAPRAAAAWLEPIDSAWPLGLFRLGSRLHLRLWRRVQEWARRPVEQAADALAFRLAGPRTAAAALIWSERMLAAAELVRTLYLPLARRAALRPSLIDGVHGVLTTPHDPSDTRRGARTLNPPRRRAGGRGAAERLAAAEQAALEDSGEAADARASLAGAQASAELIDGGREWLIAQESELLPVTSGLALAPRGDWPTAVDVGWRATNADRATELAALAAPLAAAESLGSATEAVELAADQITARDLLRAFDAQGSGPAGVGHVLGRREVGEDEALNVLVVVAARALDRAGHLRARLAWGHAPIPEYRDGAGWSPIVADAAAALPRHRASHALDVALLGVSVGGLGSRLLDTLISLDADVDAPLATLLGDPTPPERHLSCLAGVTLERDDEDVAGLWVALVDAGGVWLVPEPESRGARGRDAALAQHVLIDRVARSYARGGGPDLAAWPTSRWLPAQHLAEVHVRPGRLTDVDLVEPGGTRTTLRLPTTPASLGADPTAAFTALRTSLR